MSNSLKTAIAQSKRTERPDISQRNLSYSLTIFAFLAIFPFIMLERIDSASGATNNEAATQLFSFEEGLSPLNNYFSFAPEDRKNVRAVLWVAIKYLPTADEYYAARQDGNATEWQMEQRYGKLADIYAYVSDQTFTREQINSDSKTAENRRRFYGMVRTLTAEQVYQGIQRISKMEAEKLSPQE